MLELGIFVSCERSRSIEFFLMYVITCSLFVISLIPLTFKDATFSSVRSIFPSWCINSGLIVILYRFILRMQIIFPLCSSPCLVLVYSPSFRSPNFSMGGPGRFPLIYRDCFQEYYIEPPTFYYSVFPLFNSPYPSLIWPLPSLASFLFGGVLLL